MFNPMMDEELARLLQQERQRALRQRQRRAADMAAVSMAQEQERAVRQRLGLAVVRVGERIAGAKPRPVSVAINS